MTPAMILAMILAMTLTMTPAMTFGPPAIARSHAPPPTPQA